jgi:predicted polyphosphate/ATP-dependent NAD kinase
MIFRIGLLINPYAGLGGPIAMKGSDGDYIVNQGLDAGLSGRSNERVKIFLEQLSSYKEKIHWYSAPQQMGESILLHLGYQPTVIGSLDSSKTSAKDTEDFAKQLQEQNIDLLIFAGGDGTARNIFNALGNTQLCLGIPAGVKMHSGVFAVSPQAGARLVEEFLQEKPVSVAMQEVRDIDEEQLRAGNIQARYYGELFCPNDNRFVQQVKNSGEVDETGMQQEIAAGIVDAMVQDNDALDDDLKTLYFIGPGSTTRAVMEELGLSNTLLGVDAILDGKCIGQDLTERQVLNFIDEHKNQSISRPIRIFVTATGMQGHVFGRGNQQFSPEVLKRVGKENIDVLISPKKLSEFAERPLFMDSGNIDLDKAWSGWIKVIVGYQQTVMYPLSAGFE